MNKHLIAFIPGLTLILILTPAALFAQTDPEQPEPPANEISWAVLNGTLFVSGPGEIPDYQPGGAPWAAQIGQITKVQIYSGVTGIGKYAFYGLSNVTEVEIPASVASLGDEAFSYCGSECAIHLSCNAPSTATTAFKYCSGKIQYDCSTSWASADRQAWAPYATWEAQHLPLQKISEMEPTCTEDGKIVYQCPRCEETKDEITAPALGHDLTHCKGVPATVSSDGLTDYDLCTRCGYRTEQKTIFRARDIHLSTKKYTYNGTTRHPRVIVKDSNGKNIKSTNYSIRYTGGRNAGKYKAIVTFRNDYRGKVSRTFRIKKAKQYVRGGTYSKKYNSYSYNLKKTRSFRIKAYAKYGKVSYKKLSGHSKITVSKRGTVTIHSGIPCGTYKVRVRLQAKGTKNYYGKTVTRTVKVKIKRKYKNPWKVHLWADPDPVPVYGTSDIYIWLTRYGHTVNEQPNRYFKDVKSVETKLVSLDKDILKVKKNYAYSNMDLAKVYGKKDDIAMVKIFCTIKYRNGRVQKFSTTDYIEVSW